MHAPPVGECKHPQIPCDVPADLLLYKAPLPVARPGGGAVHPRLLPQSENILHRDDDSFGHGHHGQADKFPMGFTGLDPELHSGHFSGG